MVSTIRNVKYAHAYKKPKAAAAHKEAKYAKNIK